MTNYFFRQFYVGSLPGQTIVESSEACNQLIRDWATRHRQIMTSGQNMTSGKDTPTNTRQSLTHESPSRQFKNVETARQSTIVHEPVPSKVQATKQDHCFNKAPPVVRNIPIRLTQEPSGEFALISRPIRILTFNAAVSFLF